MPIARVNAIVDLAPEACRHCVRRLHARHTVGDPRRYQVTEVPPIAAHITEYRCHRRLCPACDTITLAPLPDEHATQFGPQLTALIAYLTVVCRMPRLVVQRFLAARASNAVEKMLCHQLAAVHNSAMNLLAYLPGAQTHTAATLPAGEMAKLGNTAARLMTVFVAGCQVLQKLQGGGTQRVIVQHQQVVVAQDGQTLIVNNPPRSCRGGARRNRGGAENGE